MKKRHNESKSNNLIRNILIGAVAAAVMAIVLGGLLALLIINENLSEDVMTYAAFVVLIVCSFAGGLLASKMAGQRFALVALGVAAAVIFIQLSVGVFFFESGFHNVLTSIASVVAGSGASCAVCISNGSKNRKRKYRHR